MRTIGIITTGGDAPGMNAAIRSTVRSAIHYKFKVIGFRRGWWGLIEKDFVAMDSRSVSNIINKGGTILHTVRCPAFKIKKNIIKAAKNLKELAPDGLVVIGGDGSMNASYCLMQSSKTPIVGIPASIDNDIAGTDETIGFDTAINTALAATDKIRDTATSHQRIFIIEVMGRKRGFLALNVGITSGAELILIPEDRQSEEKIIARIRNMIDNGKKSILIVMAEGAGKSGKLAEHLEKSLSLPVRVSRLGYIQRGGAPTVDSRMLGSVFGYGAISLLRKKTGGKMLTWNNDKLDNVSLTYPFKHTKKMNMNLIKLANILSE